MTFEGKQASKFFGTFPFPYMNGYLHLGKFHSNYDVAGLRCTSRSF